MGTRRANTTIDAIRSEDVAERSVPRGFALGVDCYETVKEHCKDTMRRLESWRDITIGTD